MTTQAPQLEAGGNAALPPPMPLASLVAEAPRKSPRPPPVHWAPMATSPLAPSPPSSALAPRRRMTGASSSLRSWSTSGRSARSSQVSSHLGSPADAPHLPRARQPHPPRRTRASHDDAATTGSGDNVAFIDSIPPVSPLLPTSPATPATPGTPSTTAARFFFLPTGAVSGGAKGVESAANEYGRWCAACDDEEHKQDLLAKTQAGSRPRSDIAAHRRWEMSARSVASVFTSQAKTSNAPPIRVVDVAGAAINGELRYDSPRCDEVELGVRLINFAADTTVIIEGCSLRTKYDTVGQNQAAIHIPHGMGPRSTLIVRRCTVEFNPAVIVPDPMGAVSVAGVVQENATLLVEGSTVKVDPIWWGIPRDTAAVLFTHAAIQQHAAITLRGTNVIFVGPFASSRGVWFSSCTFGDHAAVAIDRSSITHAGATFKESATAVDVDGGTVGHAFNLTIADSVVSLSASSPPPDALPVLRGLSITATALGSARYTITNTTIDLSSGGGTTSGGELGGIVVSPRGGNTSLHISNSTFNVKTQTGNGAARCISVNAVESGAVHVALRDSVLVAEAANAAAWGIIAMGTGPNATTALVERTSVTVSAGNGDATGVAVHGRGLESSESGDSSFGGDAAERHAASTYHTSKFMGVVIDVTASGVATGIVANRTWTSLDASTVTAKGEGASPVIIHAAPSVAVVASVLKALSFVSPAVCISGEIAASSHVAIEDSQLFFERSATMLPSARSAGVALEGSTTASLLSLSIIRSTMSQSLSRVVSSYRNAFLNLPSLASKSAIALCNVTLQFDEAPTAASAVPYGIVAPSGPVIDSLRMSDVVWILNNTAGELHKTPAGGLIGPFPPPVPCRTATMSSTLLPSVTPSSTAMPTQSPTSSPHQSLSVSQSHQRLRSASATVSSPSISASRLQSVARSPSQSSTSACLTPSTTATRRQDVSSPATLRQSGDVNHSTGTATSPPTATATLQPWTRSETASTALRPPSASVTETATSELVVTKTRAPLHPGSPPRAVPAPEGIPTTAKAVAMTAGSVGGTVAAVTGAGVAGATQAGRTLAILELVACARQEPSLQDGAEDGPREAPFPQALLPFVHLGGGQAGLDRGVVIGNALAVGLVFVAATFTWAAAGTAVGRLTARGKATRVGAAPESNAPEAANTPFVRMCRLMRYPGAALSVPLGFALDGFVGGAAALVRQWADGAATAADLALGMAAAGATAALLAAAVYVTVVVAPRHAEVVPTFVSRSPQAGLAQRLRRLRDGAATWTPLGTSAAAVPGYLFLAQWSVLFAPLRHRVRWFVALDAVASVAIAVARGVRPQTPAGCRRALATVAAVQLGYTVAVLVLRPFLSPLRTAAVTASAVLLTAAALVGAVAGFEETAPRVLVDAAGHLAAAAAVALFASPVLAVWRFVDARVSSANGGAAAERDTAAMFFDLTTDAPLLPANGGVGHRGLPASEELGLLDGDDPMELLPPTQVLTVEPEPVFLFSPVLSPALRPTSPPEIDSASSGDLPASLDQFLSPRRSSVLAGLPDAKADATSGEFDSNPGRIRHDPHDDFATPPVSPAARPAGNSADGEPESLPPAQRRVFKPGTVVVEKAGEGASLALELEHMLRQQEPTGTPRPIDPFDL